MKKYWQDIEDINKQSLKEDSNHKENGVSLINILEDQAGSTRRDFLKLFGFSVASVSVLASCEKPVTKAIPYLIKPETITPGKADYYASSFYDGEQYASILVKVRDGRPIKIEGNELSTLTKGKSSAIVQASVLELYDDNRVQKPLKRGQEISWQTADEELIEQFNRIKDKNGKVVLLSSSIISPSTLQIIDEFKGEYPGLEHVMYDPVSFSAMLDANEVMFGKRLVPNYKLEKAQVIVSFNADFLGNWLAPVEMAAGYASARKLDEGEKHMARHIQFETGMSLSGANADERVTIKPSEEKLALATLYHKLLKLSGKDQYISLAKCEVELDKVAEELYVNKRKSLVISGTNDPDCQKLINAINDLLENYGKTIEIDNGYLTRKGADKALKQLVNDMNDGNVDALLVYNANPAYDYPDKELFKKALSKVPVSVSFSVTNDEIADIATYVLPDNHYLESWNDANPRPGNYSLAQPAIRKLFDTRQFQDTVLTWLGKETDFREYMKQYWNDNLYQLGNGYANFTDFWNHSLQDGVFTSKEIASSSVNINLSEIDDILKSIASKTGGIEVHLFENNSIGTGKHTNNPWLQETPESITKVTWDNFAAISPKFAEDNGLKTGDVISIEGIEIPTLVQPGQKYGTISIALGYGRKKTGKAGLGVGVNAFSFTRLENGYRNYFDQVDFKKTGKTYQFALTQTHNSMEGRPLIREATLEEYLEYPGAGNEWHKHVEKHLDTLYEKHKYEGHHWGMTVDLNTCIGCNACVVGCTAENNVPVVGKEEVRRVHEMHWVRIDRYYAGDPENPEVAVQPVMCQHCDNAPCENVCPVAATTHSDEGINQMAYNRCIGTRYCNNNCPYKVRRFNWFDYTQADALPANTVDPAGMTLDLPRMVLNPDVTVRAKGVMEKCSFCIQRIQDKKLQAKLEGRPLVDGEVKTACQQACPTNAITFGDMSDKESRLSKLMKSKRNYHLLEELHTLPSVGYLTKIRNKELDPSHKKGKKDHSHG